MEAGALRKLIYDATKETSNGPVDIVNANNEFKSTYDILLDISKVWKELDDMTKATLLEKIAGKHRASVVSALLNDTKTLEDAYADALQSAGSASEEFEKRTKSIEYHLQQLYAAWQELATNTATVEWINGIIDGLRSIVELVNKIGLLNLGSALTGAVGGFGLFHKLIPAIEGIGLDATEKKEKFKVLGDGFKKIAEVANSSGMEKASKNIYKLIDGFDLFEGKSPLVAGGIKVIANALLTFTKTIPVMLIAGGGVALITELLGKYEEWKNRAVTAADETNTLANELKNLQAEYELLSGKETLTDVEKERLEVLKDEIALQEADLKLSKQRLAELNTEKYSHIKTDHNGNKYLDDSLTSDELLTSEIDNASHQYADATVKIKNLREELKLYNDQVHDTTASEEDRQIALENLSRIKQELTAAQTQQTSAQDQMQENYNALLTQESELAGIIENNVDLTEDEIASYQDKLDKTRDDIELQKILLGLEGANADFGKQQIELYDTYKKTTGIIDELNTGHEISREKLAHLEKEFPGLIDATLKYGDEANGAYTLSKESLETLNSVHATSLSNMNDNELARTIVAKENALKRVAMYQAEATAIGQLSQAMANIQGGNQGLLNEAKNADTMAGKVAGTLKWAAAATQTASVEQYKPFIDSKANGINEKLNDAQAEADAYAKQIEEIIELINGIDPTKTGNGTENGDPLGDGDPGNGGSSSSGSGSKKSADIWDKYAHALAKANDEIERYNKVVEITQGKLDLNQSTENRTVELLAEEVQLYDELIASTKAKYKVVNDTLWAQQQGLQKMYTEAAKYMGLDADAVANMTDADLEAYIELKLDEDKANDQKIAHLLNGIIDMRENVHGLHLDWLDMKAEIKELEREEINIRINLQADLEEKFDASREGAKKVLDILEEMEGTETQRAEILGQMAESYESEINSNMQLYAENSERLLEMAKAGNTESDEYNDLLEHANEIQLRNLDLIKEQLDTRLKQIEAEKELAVRQLETQVYGEQGQDAWEKSRENEIDRLQNQLDALDEDTSEADYLEELEEKEETIRKLEEKLANLQRERTVKQLKQEEDGSWQWEYVVDDRAIAETQAELDDARADLQKTKDDKALEYKKDAIQNRIDAIEDEIESRAERLDLMNQQDAEFYDEQERMAQEHAEKQVEIMNDRTTKTVQALNNLETKTRSGLKEVDKATAQGLSALSDTYSERLGSMSSMISSWVGEIIDEFNRLQAAQRAAQEEAEGIVGASYVASVASGGKVAAGGIKFVEANNFHARLHYGARVLTRQEAAQYNELEEDIKSGKLEAYFNSLREDTVMSFSDAATASVMRTTSMPTTNSNTTSFVIENLELPEVKDPTDFARVIDNWARGEFGGMVQRARIVKAK